MSERTPGIDVAWPQGKLIDWPRVSAGETKFAFLKATEGVSGVDPTFARNRKDSIDPGLLVGAYHYGHLEYPAEAQARHAWLRSEQLGLNDGELPPVLDIEQTLPPIVTPVSAVQWIADYLEAISALAKRQAILYTFPYYWDVVTAGSKEIPEPIKQSLLWIAQYSRRGIWLPGEQENPRVPGPWDRWDFWQYSGNGGERIPGIPTDVDRNLFNGSLQDLQRVSLRQAPRCEPALATPAPDAPDTHD